MRSLVLATAAALAVATVPAALGAQDAAPGAAPEGASQPAQAAPRATPAAVPTGAPSTAAEANTRAMPGPPVREVIPPAGPGQPETIVTTYPGNLTPPPAAALNKDYPVCTRSLQDNCRNPGEGGNGNRG